MHWVPRGWSDGSIWKCVRCTGSVFIRSRNDMLPESLSSCSISLSIPGSNSAIIRYGDNVLPIGIGSTRFHPFSVPQEMIANCSTSLGIPDSNGAVVGSGDDVQPIGRASNRQHQSGVHLERVTDCSTSISIP